MTPPSVLWLSIPVVFPKICQRLLQGVCYISLRVVRILMCRQIDRTGITTVSGVGSTGGTAT